MLKSIVIFLFVLSNLNLVLLTFTFRDFSFALLAQFFLSALGLPLTTAMLLQLKEKEKILCFSSKEEKTGKLDNVWIEEDAEEYNLEGRFCIND
tara:strand:- start:150 stop:431 length:282 start_codon:yes stop_codon:yes gene_type:complete